MRSRVQLPRPRPGFTLIELLVVVAVIAVLASLLMPVINRAMEQSNASTCMGHLRQLTQGCILYAGRHGQIITCTYLHSDGKRSFWQHCLVNEGQVDPRELPCPNEMGLTKKDWETWEQSWNTTGAPLWWYAYNPVYGLCVLRRPHCTKAPSRSEWLLTTEVKTPSEVVYWADACFYGIYYRQGCDPTYPESRTSNQYRRLVFRHMDGLNLIFFDYHGEWMLGKDVHPTMWVPTDNWTYP